MRREKQIMEWRRGWKLILSSGVIQIGWSLLDLIAVIPPRFCDWFGQRREDNEPVSFSITQSAESHLRCWSSGWTANRSRSIWRKENSESRHSWRSIPQGG